MKELFFIYKNTLKKAVSHRDFLEHYKRLTKIFVSLFIFCFVKHTTLLAKYSVLHF